MKLVHPDISTILNTDDAGVQTIVIENPIFMRAFVQDIISQINGLSGKLVLSKNDRPIEFSKNAELIQDVVGFDINQKSLLTKIINSLEKESRLPGNDYQSQHILQEIELFIDQLAFSFPCNISYSKLGMGMLLKSVGIQLQDDYDNILERIIDYMELVREFDKDKLFITLNLRSFISDTECKMFIETLVSHELNLIMIEGYDHTMLEGEKRLTIDQDLCEF